MVDIAQINSPLFEWQIADLSPANSCRRRGALFMRRAYPYRGRRGLTRKTIQAARQIRDAKRAEPGIVRRVQGSLLSAPLPEPGHEHGERNASSMMSRLARDRAR